MSSQKVTATRVNVSVQKVFERKLEIKFLKFLNVTSLIIVTSAFVNIALVSSTDGPQILESDYSG